MSGTSRAFTTPTRRSGAPDDLSKRRQGEARGRGPLHGGPNGCRQERQIFTRNTGPLRGGRMNSRVKISHLLTLTWFLTPADYVQHPHQGCRHKRIWRWQMIRCRRAFSGQEAPGPHQQQGSFTVFLLGLVTQFSLCGPSFEGEEFTEG